MNNDNDDIGQQLYLLLVRRGYAQHEAYAIAHGARLAKVCTENCVENGEPSIECLEHGLPDTAEDNLEVQLRQATSENAAAMRQDAAEE